MESAEQPRPVAWQPLTPRGVAAFAEAGWRRVLWAQFLTALAGTLVVTWFVANDWFPTIRAAIEQLPTRGRIESGRLNWSGDSPALLAESRYLALVVDLRHSGRIRSPAHLQVELGRMDVRIYSLFGCLEAPYPKGYLIALNLEELKPWWGAWTPVLLAATAAGVVAGLFASWALLATGYCLPAWLLGLYRDRELSVCGSWRLAGAAVVPGALVMIVGMALYALGGLDLVHLIGAWMLHLVLGWTYLILGVLARPKLRVESSPLKANPFARAAAQPAKAPDKDPGSKPSNPFSPKR